MSEAEPGLFDPITARGPAAAAVSDRAWLAALLEVEAALARAAATVGVIPRDHAEAIGEACGAADLDAGALGAEAAASGTPVVPLVRALRARLAPGPAASLHRGATSQDVMDSAAMLVAQRALEAMGIDLAVSADRLAELAETHRRTLMPARTLLQQALPTTFGAQAANWLIGLDTARHRLRWVAGERLAVQLGGAAGTLARLGEAGPAVVHEFATQLGLCEPAVPWHVERGRLVDLAGALALASAAIAKPALDIVLLAQTEVGEVHDDRPHRGGSSTLPQKRNPVAAVAARACAAGAPGLVANLIAAAGQAEHQRAAGAWHAEWQPLRELLRTTGSAAAWLRDALEHLVVDAERMRANLELSGGAILAERIAAALEERTGGPLDDELAAAVVAVASGGGTPAERLEANPAVAAHLDAQALASLLDPSGYLGGVDEFINRALAGRRP